MGAEVLDPDSAFLARFRVDYARYLVRVERLAEARTELVTARDV